MPSRRTFDLSSPLCGNKSLESQHTEKFPTEDKVLALNLWRQVLNAISIGSDQIAVFHNITDSLEVITWSEASFDGNVLIRRLGTSFHFVMSQFQHFNKALSIGERLTPDDFEPASISTKLLAFVKTTLDIEMYRSIANLLAFMHLCKKHTYYILYYANMNAYFYTSISIFVRIHFYNCIVRFYKFFILLVYLYLPCFLIS